MDEKQNLVMLFEQIGLRNERCWKEGGLYTPQEIAERVHTLGATYPLSHVLSLVEPHLSKHNLHELLHCIDVGFGSAELLQELQAANVLQDLYFPHTPRDAFLAGFFHDLALSLSPNGLEETIDRSELARISEKPITGQLYNKGPIEDDVFGFLLAKALPHVVDMRSERITDYASVERALLSGVKDQTTAAAKTSAPTLHKVLDGIWYHDGNYPVRGFAEAAMLVSDRLPLFASGAIDLGVIKQGIDKLLTYTVIEEGWEERCSRTDPTYLHRMVEKKAPGFLSSIQGTRAYDFIVDDLAVRSRGYRTLKSEAFEVGATEMGTTLKQLDQHHVLRNAYGHEIETLARRYDTFLKIISRYR